LAVEDWSVQTALSVEETARRRLPSVLLTTLGHPKAVVSPTRGLSFAAVVGVGGSLDIGVDGAGTFVVPELVGLTGRGAARGGRTLDLC
jgi:hypothetical protein